MTSVSVEPNTILFSILWCLFFLVTVRVVLWIWATNMVAKPGFYRLELNHLSLLYGDTTCHKLFECFPPVMVGSIPKAAETHFFDGTPNLEDVLFCSFAIHWSFVYHARILGDLTMQTSIPGSRRIHSLYKVLLSSLDKAPLRFWPAILKNPCFVPVCNDRYPPQN